MKDLIGSFVAGLFVVAVVVSGAIAANAASLTHSYDFNNSFSDTLGNGADMVSGGGVRGATGLSFGKNEGPIFSGTLSSATDAYAIEMQVTLDAIGSYTKLIDFKNLSPDTGFYQIDGNLQLFNASGPDGGNSLLQGVSTNILFARTSFGIFSGYINGVLAISGTDPTGLAVANTQFIFLQDDFATSRNEATSGFLDYIRFYDFAATPNDLVEPNGVIPIPAALPLLLSGLLGLGAMGWWRRKAV